ncbi:MAG: DNA primase [Candidatus Marinimicrobia bacterium]|nr:DNA primase [Candidatus Neomarinimicrobiota bacterium]MCF7829438.1 DNA primase [Candidatus Neomarinimicrobiota bacterium]MCF7880924.1 DNA primase [Candidatus Neomarinimicrobiota bacterium]
MARIPEDTIDQIRDANDIVDVVSQYVPLKKRGKNYFGKCPFHQEKTASFSVAPDKQIFHCFGCGKGGNVYSFIMEYEKVSFVEAVERLAENAGIELPKYSAKDKGTDSGSLGPLYDANAFAMRLFEKALYSDQGEEALDYLLGRNFSEETLREFHVGYAPNDWETITEWGPKNDHDPDTLVRAGLVIHKQERNRYFDRFRHRVMFPIINNGGRVVAFGGRALDPDENAKYMNSPESPIYRKRKLLYGLYQAKDALRQSSEVIVVEGYTDLMRLWEHKFQNVIAVSGTAFTEQHAQILNRYVDKAVLCYDSDTAGIQATLRAGEILLQSGLEVRCIQLPDGHDPDTYISEESPESFRKQIKNATSLMQFRISRTAGQLNDASSRANFIKETLDDIAEYENSLTRDLQIQELAELIRVDEQRLRGELEKRLRRTRSRPPRQNKKEPSQVSDEQDFDSNQRAQYELLKLMLTEDEKLITYILEHVTTDEFTHPVLTRVAQVFVDYLAEHPILDPQDAMPLFDEADFESAERRNAAKEMVSRMLFELDESNQTLRKEQMARDCLMRLELNQVQSEVDRINDELHSASLGKEESMALLEQRKKLEQLKKEIREKYR